MTTEPNRPPHSRVAEELGLTIATVSRIRSGDRLPSLVVMRQISKLYGWTIDEQLEARDHGEYASRFNRKLAESSPAPEPRGE
jgi:transcriptional regulator with XRE-family HTH domain